MTTQAEIDEQQKLLATHRKTLAILLEQRAKHTSANVPPSIEHGIDEARQNIKAIKQVLKLWGIQISDNTLDNFVTEDTLASDLNILPPPNQTSKVIATSRENIRFSREASLEYMYRQRQKVMIYWHNEGLTKADALELVGFLADIGVRGTITKHIKEAAPDAIFISPQASAALTRQMLEKITYKISYIFPIDYPDPECGALSDFVMSVGLQSSTNKEFRSKQEEPIRLKRGQLKRLMEPGLNNNEFRHRLIQIASSTT